MKRAVIYARVSTQRQADDGVSMDSQIEQCHMKAQALGVVVDQVFRDDGVSGRTDKRPGFQAAMAFCAANPVSHFICWSTSRFGRNLLDALKNMEQLVNWGTKPAYVHQDIDPQTDQGWMVAVMTGMMDEMQSRTIARDTLRSMVSASRDGWWVGGRAPYGYRPEKVGKRSKLVPYEDEAAVVRTMFRLVIEERLGAQAIALRLNAQKLTRNGKPWGKTTVTNILKNRSYMGYRYFNQTEKRTRSAKAPDELVRVASHPALVSEEDFERAQIMMEERRPHHEAGGTPKSLFAFTGLARCGICGEALQITNGTGRGGVMYSYYSCLAHRSGKPRCFFKSIPADRFDEWMLSGILDKVLTTEVVQAVLDEITSKSHSWIQERGAQRKALVRDLRDRERRRDKLFELLEVHGKSTPNLDDLSGRLRQLSLEIEDLQLRLTRLEISEPPDFGSMKIDPAVAVEMMRERIEHCEDKRQLRGLLGTFVHQVTVSNNNARVEYREDALLRAPTATVHSGVRWLPDQIPLRTGKIEFELPEEWPRVRVAA